MNSLIDLGIKAKAASKALISASPELKNEALRSIAKALCENANEIIKANEFDIKTARLMDNKSSEFFAEAEARKI